jgi:hypothetical protein
VSEPANVLDFDDLRVAAKRAAQARLSMARLAREDPCIFAQYVGRDEVTHRPIRLAPMHEAWHGLVDKHDKLVLWSHVEAGKTFGLSVMRVLWEVGRDPTLRVLVLSATQTQSNKIASAIAGYVETSDELHEVFPDLRPTQRAYERWQPLSGKLTVRRETESKDATITTAGVHSQGVLGARYDLVILDDVLNAENTGSVEQRRQLVEWLQSTVQSRLTARGRLWVVGTAWHPGTGGDDPGDAMHHYARLFPAFRYPVLDDGGQPRWPERWPMERIDEKKRTIHPAEFARQMMCEARDDSSSMFKQAWIDVALNRGAGRVMQRNNLHYGPHAGMRYYTGVDLAVQHHSSADLTVLCTIAVYPNQDRELLEVLAGRWHGPDILARILDVHSRFQSIVYVENNAAQDYILQFTRHVSAVPVKPFTTGRNKAHPEHGVESLAVEMQNGKWILPCQGGRSPELQALVSEMLYYDPRVHVGDRLMALWFAREAARMGAVQAQVGRLDLLSR